MTPAMLQSATTLARMSGLHPASCVNCRYFRAQQAVKPEESTIAGRSWDGCIDREPIRAGSVYSMVRSHRSLEDEMRIARIISAFGIVATGVLIGCTSTDVAGSIAGNN